MKSKQQSKAKANSANVKKVRTRKQSRLAMLDDDDIPTTRSSKSIQEIEENQGHGFWGNSTTGYIYDKDTKDEKRYKQR